MAYTYKEDRENTGKLKDLISQRILVVDGATGTALASLHPTNYDFGGETYNGCNEMLNVHAPEIVKKVHHAYISAGADIIETNSFGALPMVLDDYGIGEKAFDLAKRSAELARKAITASGADRSVFVMGSMGPGTRSISITGGITFDDVIDQYRIIAKGLLEGGADILLIETVQDTLNLKAALIGVWEAKREMNRCAPVSVSVTIENGGRMLGGQNIEALYYTLEDFDLFSLGINCATGPVEMREHLRTLADISRFPVTVWPNAGLPDQDGNYSEDPEKFACTLKRFASEGMINIAGGCCGTTPEHIRSLEEALTDQKPRTFNRSQRHRSLAGLDPLQIEKDNIPVFIGERTNTIGSRRFKRLIAEAQWEVAAEIGSEQVKKGAMALDLCTSDPDRNEAEDFRRIVTTLQRKVRVPVLIDSTDLDTIETALKSITGKSAINSVNIEDGGKKLLKTTELAKKYGASLVCGLIDDDPESGMAVSLERKLEVAGRIHRILTEQAGFDETNIIFDPLVFPAGTGDPQYAGAAKATIDAITLLKKKYPACMTILGISNVSFGLGKYAREVLNSVMLHLASRAGLDMAIINTQRLKRYPSIESHERKLAEKILLSGNIEAVKELASLSAETLTVETDDNTLSPEDLLIKAVVEGRRTGLAEIIEAVREKHSPMEIINGPLLEGMNEVGRQFSDNRLIVAEVLESAEVMKAAVYHLKPYMEGEGYETRGTVLLATVKGDVHDIGKNLVEIILSNNGYRVVNIGIKVDAPTLIKAIGDHRPDVIGLSGLLIRSAEYMAVTASELSRSGVDIPLVVGGAALTEGFVNNKIKPQYGGIVRFAANAMEGLRIVRELTDNITDRSGSARPVGRAIIISEKDKLDSSATAPSWIKTDVLEPPDPDRHIVREIPFAGILPYLNEQSLFSRHLGVKKFGLNQDSDKVLRLKDTIETILSDNEHSKIITPRCTYRWFPVEPLPDGIKVVRSGENEPGIFHFPRQSHGERLSAVDWIRPPESGGDHICLFIATTGSNYIDAVNRTRNAGDLLESLIIQSLAIELTEAAVEWTHRRIRAEWGFPDPDDLLPGDVLKGRYRGVRMSIGYPAVPDLEDQRLVFRLLKPGEIGVTLTSSLMMSPELSVSAIVFHHPEARHYRP